MRLSRTLLILLTCFYACPVYAGDVIVLQPLNFGSWLIPGNNTVYNITIQPDGNYSNSPELTMLSPPTEGIYDVGDLPPSTVINSLDVTVNAPLEFGGQSFDMAGFQTSAAGATDSNGRVTVNVGATASTTGSGGGYAPGNYTGALDLNFDVNF